MDASAKISRTPARLGLVTFLALVLACGGGDGGTGPNPPAPPPPPPPPPPGGAVASVTLAPGVDSLFVGAGLQLTATVRDASNGILTGRTVTWTSDNPSLAQVSTTGQVVGLYHGGPVTIRATVEGVTGTATVTVRPPQGPSFVEMRSVLDSSRAAFLRFGAQTNGDPARALALASERIAADPRVRQVTPMDTTALLIELITGMVTILQYTEFGADRKSVFRGGGGGGGSSAVEVATRTEPGRVLETVTNKKVLFCAATTDEFYQPGELQQVSDMARNAGLRLQVEVLQDAQCSWQAVQTFPSYGLVIIETHGFEVGFQVGGLVTVPAGVVTDSSFKATVDAHLGAGTYDHLVTANLGTTQNINVGPEYAGWWEGDRLGESTYKLWVTSQFIRQLRMPNTIILGNFCYSGTHSGWAPAIGHIQPAFLSTGVASYYGYAFADGTSQQVPNVAAIRMEKQLLTGLLIDGDSTGIAHLDAASHETVVDSVKTAKIVGGAVVYGPVKQLLFRQFNAPDWRYVEVAIDPDPAEGEFGAPVSFLADDNGTAPDDAIYDWDFGDGTPKVRVAGSPQIQHTFQVAPGGDPCQEAEYTVELELSNNATGTPIPVAKAQGIARIKGPCPTWLLTSISDPSDEFGDEFDHFDATVISPMFRKILVTPGAGLLTLSQQPGQPAGLALVVRRTGAWVVDSCCALPPAVATDALLLGPAVTTPNNVGPYFAGWESNFLTQSTPDLTMGTMQSQRAFGTVVYTIPNAGSQIGPSGGVRVTGTRNGDVMAGAITFYLWFLDDLTGEVSQAIPFAFPFTARLVR